MAVKWEYEVGPLTVNFRVLVEPKGFLRLVMVVIAILAFSITAGFTDGPNDNSLECTSSSDNISRTVQLRFEYPFLSQNFRAVYTPFDELIVNAMRNHSSCETNNGFDDRSFAGFSQFFVAMGVLTFLYCLGIVLVYVLFITPKLPFAKWIAVFDFIASILFAFLYLLADILWSAGIAGLDTYIETDLIRRATLCLGCRDSGGNLDVDSGVFAQPAMSVVFGWLLCFVWFASLWFTYKDTFWHKDRTGPLAEVYSPEGGAAAKTSEQNTGQSSAPGPTPAPPPETVTGAY